MPRIVDIKGLDNESTAGRSSSTRIYNEIEILTSRPVLEAVVDSLRLAEAPESWGTPDVIGNVVAALKPVTRGLMDMVNTCQPCRTALTSLGIAEAESGAALAAPTNPDELRELAIDQLLNQMRAYQAGASDIIEVTFKAMDPQLARDVANSLIRSYLEQQVRHQQARAERLRHLLEGWAGGLRHRMHTSANTVEQFEKSLGIVDIGKHSHLAEQIVQLSQKLVDAKAGLAATETSEAAVRTRVAEQGLRAALDKTQSDAVWKLLEREALLAEQLSALSTRFGAKHPQVIAVSEQLTTVRQQVSGIARQKLHELNSDVLQARARVSAIWSELKAVNDAYLQLRADAYALRAMEQEADIDQNVYHKALLRSREAELLQTADLPNSQVIYFATLPKYASEPRLGLIAALFGFFGTGCGAIGVVMREMARRDFISAAIRHAGINILVSLPYLPRMKRQQERMRFAYEEAVQSLATTIMAASVGNQPIRSVMVTSAFAGEGKTMTSTALFYSLAEAGCRVALVDADFRRPSVARALGLEDGPGITELLRDDLPLSTVLVVHEKTGGVVLRAGQSDTPPHWVVTRPAFRKLMDDLKQTMDIVIIDTGPVMQVSDPLRIAQMCDATIAVCEWKRTRVADLEALVLRLQQVRAHLLGAVISKADAREDGIYSYCGDKKIAMLADMGGNS